MAIYQQIFCDVTLAFALILVVFVIYKLNQSQHYHETCWMREEKENKSFSIGAIQKFKSIKKGNINKGKHVHINKVAQAHKYCTLAKVICV